MNRAAQQRVAPVSPYQVLHRFSLKGPDPAAFPTASLLNLNGTLYGVTAGQGSGNKDACGTVFSMSTTGVTKTIYRFHGPDGCFPRGTLTDVNGTLYGATYGGGGYPYDGTVFSLTTSGVEKVLYTFKGAPDGAEPWSGPTAVNGTLYGTTYDGGQNNLGTVYSISTSGVELWLFRFGTHSDDGCGPSASLIAVKDKLYGTTTQCGGGGGAVFSITTAGVEKVLYGFTGGADGKDPSADPLISVNGMFYGATEQGGSSGDGVVYRMTLSGSEKVLYSFAGGSDEVNPNGLTYRRGMFYGTTSEGGGSGCHTKFSTGCGTVYSLTPGGSQSVLHRFKGGRDGQWPDGALLDRNGTFYGNTSRGGGEGCTRRGCGTTFAITPQ